MIYFEGVALGRYPDQLILCRGLYLHFRPQTNRLFIAFGLTGWMKYDRSSGERLRDQRTGRYRYLFPLSFFSGRWFLRFLGFLGRQLDIFAVDIEKVEEMGHSDINQCNIDNSNHHKPTILSLVQTALGVILPLRANDYRVSKGELQGIVLFII